MCATRRHKKSPSSYRLKRLFVPAGDWSVMLDRQSTGEHLPLGTFVPPPPGQGLTKKDLFADVDCPVCNTVMERTPFGAGDDVIVDLCRQHGTWFDSGELVRAIQRVRIRELTIAAGEDAPSIPLHPAPEGERELKRPGLSENLIAFTGSVATTVGEGILALSEIERTTRMQRETYVDSTGLRRFNDSNGVVPPGYYNL
jgi:hypothetical protein